MSHREVLSTREFCAIYGVGETTAFALMKRGAIQRVKIGAATRITRESAARWFETLPRDTAQSNGKMGGGQ